MSHVYHWKHGWIPLTHTAALSKAKGNHQLAATYMADAPHAQGIQSRQHVAKAVMDLPNIPNVADRADARRQIKEAAAKHDAHDLLPKSWTSKSTPAFKLSPVTDWQSLNRHRDEVAQAAADGRVTMVPAGARNNATAEIHVDGQRVGEASVLGHHLVSDGTAAGSFFKEHKMNPRPGWKRH